MAFLTPSSRVAFRLKWSPFDLIWAGLSPLLALYIRDAYILSYKEPRQLRSIA
jgi:hypothetical protein